MSQFPRWKFKILLAVFILSGVFLWILTVKPVQAISHVPGDFLKTYNDTLGSENWNNLLGYSSTTALVYSGANPLGNFVNTWLPAVMLGPLGINAEPNSTQLTIKGTGGNVLDLLDSSGTNLFTVLNNGRVGIGTDVPNDTLSIGNAGVAPAGSAATGHNYTSTYLSTDNYALVNYGLLKTVTDLFVPGGSNSLWSGTSTADIWNSNSGNVGIGTSTPAEKLTVTGNLFVDLPTSGAATFIEDPAAATSTGKIQLGRTVDGWESISFDPTLGSRGKFVFSAPIQVAASSPGVTFYDPNDPTNTDKQRSIEYNATDLQLKIGDSFKTNFSTNTGMPPANKVFFQIGPNDLSSAATQGIFIGANPPSNFTGDLLHFQVGGLTRFRVTKFGDIISGGATMTDNGPIINTTQTWDNSVVPFTAWLMRITDTNSSSTSRLLDLQVNTSSKFIIRKDGFVGIDTTNPNDLLSIGNSGAAPAGSAATGHNYTSTYLSTDNYALTNYGLVKTLIAGGSGSSVGYWTMNGTNINNSNSGNVGIGTTNPGAKLEVSGNLLVPNVASGGYFGSKSSVGTTWALLFVDANNYTNIGAADTGNSNGIIFRSNDGEKMRLNSSGNLGIGTTNPTYTLDIFAPSGYASQRLISSSSAAFIQMYGTGGWPAGVTYGANDGSNKTWLLGMRNTTGPEAYQFWAEYYNGSGSWIQPIKLMPSGDVLMNAGKVGVGTTNPGTKLSIYNETDNFNGAQKPSTVLNLGAYLNDVNEGASIDFNLRWAGGWESTSQTTGWLAGRIAGIYDSQVDNGGALSFYTNSGVSASGGANSAEVTEKMRIRPNGSVGIGTTAPNDTFSIGNSGAAPAGSAATGHNYTSTYLSTDNYALTNYGLVKTLIAGGSGSSVGYWTMNGTDINNSNSGNVGIGTTAPGLKLDVNATAGLPAVSGTTQTGNFRLSQAGGVALDMGINANSPYGGWLQSTNKADLSQTYSLLLNPNGGNVGIGTTNPGAKLDVLGTIAGDTLRLGYGGTFYYKMGRDSDGFLSFQGTQAGYTGYNFLSDDSSSLMRIIDNGNVGIGTTNPGSSLHVYSNTTAPTRITVESASSTGWTAADILLKTAVTARGTGIYTYDSAGQVTSYFGRPYNDSSAAFVINRKPSSATFQVDTAESGASGVNNLFYVKTDGNVGIGVTNPDKKLSITGSVASDDEYLIHLRKNAGWGSPGILFGAGNVATKGKGAILYRNTEWNWGRGDFYFLQNQSNDDSEATIDSAVMVIQNSGNVGISTTAPNDTFSIGNSGAAPAGSAATGHNYTNTYLSTDNYALTNYGLVKTLIAGGSGSSVGYWTMNGTDIYNSNSGNVGVGTTNSVLGKLQVIGGIVSGVPGNSMASGLGIKQSANSVTSGVLLESATNTNNGGMYITDTGLVFREGGINTLTVDGGSVGIGTTNPKNKFQISGANSSNPSDSIFSLQKNEEGYGLFAGVKSNGNSFIQVGTWDNSTKYNLELQPNGGNVGIGTTNPTQKLHISAGNQLLNKTYGILWTDDRNDEIRVDDSPAWLSGTNNNTMTFKLYSAGGDNSGKFVFARSNGPTPVMLINADTGNVGIGTTAPNDTFSIGNSGAAPAGSAATGHNYTSTYLSTDNYALTNYGLVKTLIAGGSGSSVGYWTMNGTNINNSNAGNVGIGTTSPVYTLEVNGTFKVGTSSSSIILDASGNILIGI